MANDNVSALLALKGGGSGGGSGSSDLFVITVTGSGGSYTADKTYAEITAAYSAGKVVQVVHDTTLYSSSVPYEFINVEYDGSENSVFVATFFVNSSDVWTKEETTCDTAPTPVTVTGSTPTIAAEDNHIYECGECSSLTVSSFPASGKFWIWFTSGSTPTTVTGIDNFTPEANKKYRVFVENGYATFDAWSVGGGS